MFIAVAPTATAQDTTIPACFPQDIVDYPPNTEAIGGLETLTLVLAEGDLDPEVGAATSTTADGIPVNRLAITGAEAGAGYCGVLRSTPVVLPRTTASSAGKITFSGIKLPADFEYDAAHHLDVFRGGRIVGQFDFCVKTGGSITSLNGCPAKALKNANNNGNLPKTGLDRVWEMLQIGLVLVALGALVIYGRRRLEARQRTT
jgi:hypothetical protein